MTGESVLVLMQNAEYGENMYTEWDEKSKDADHRVVSTWFVKDLNPMRFFRLSGLYRQGTFRVQVNSVFHVLSGEPLMSPPEKSYMIDSERRPAYCWRSKTSPPPVDSIDWFMETDVVNEKSPVPNRYRVLERLNQRVSVR